MMDFPVLNFQDFIQADGDELTTTSLQVAAVFGKRHADVLRDIRDLLSKLPADRKRNFAETVEMRENPSGGAYIKSPMFHITRDGFTWLAMRFRGRKALAFQVAYTDAFNAMSAFIKNQQEGLQYRYLRKELELKTRKSQISQAAREMRYWRDERPTREGEMKKMLAEMQPGLNLN